MAARAAAFADPEVIKLASTEFLPLAENCSPLQTKQDAKGEFFRLVAEQGHYGGRTVPSATRQGQYAFAPDGHLLASINTRDADKLLGMVRQALDRWHALRAERESATVESGAYERHPRYPDFYPADGLAHKQTLRGGAQSAVGGVGHLPVPGKAGGHGARLRLPPARRADLGHHDRAVRAV